ncbi:MAG: hypothetical protein GF313_05345, partial [Caldithrix sp.]|nr:hypothetical protein [Caldithrix sp.]
MNLVLSECIREIKRLKIKHPYRVHFQSPADENDIQAMEAQFGIQLPQSYKSFLKHFNGGFISQNPTREN